MTAPDRPRGSVLVAGGTGALGTAVVTALLDAGFPVVTTWVNERERDHAASQFAHRAGLTLLQADLTAGPPWPASSTVSRTCGPS